MAQGKRNARRRGGHGMRPDVQAFLRDYEVGTTLCCTKPNHRVWRHAVQLQVTAHYGQVYLRRIQALDPGRGDGTRCLRWLIKLADKHSVELIGHASNDFAGKTEKPGVMVLRRWYKRHGARFDRHGAFTFNGDQ